MSNSGHRAVFVVDHDGRTCGEVKAAVKGLQVRQFPSGRDFLEFYDRTLSGCLVVNAMLPDMTGLEMQDRLLSRYCTLPFIFIGKGSSVAQAVLAMRKGAIDFLDRPFQKHELSKAIHAALEIVEQRQSDHAELADLADRFEQLTAREREVMDAIVAGKSNRAVGENLAISEKTVETHRLRLMNKMRVKSLADLVRAALRLREFQVSRADSIEAPEIAGVGQLA